MNDTHDERGGDETPLARVQAFQRAANPNGDYHWPAEEAANVGGVPLYFDDIESLSAADNFDAVEAVVARWRKTEKQLAAVTARAEKAEAERDELREYVTALNEAQVSLQFSSFEVGWWKGFKAMPTAGVHTQACLDTVEYADELRALNAGAAVAPDALQDGLSGPVERSETSGGHGEGSNSSATAAGLSEAEPPRDTSAWCWAPNPHTLLHCGLLRDHEPPHRRGERTWIDDTTEDGQHG